MTEDFICKFSILPYGNKSRVCVMVADYDLNCEGLGEDRETCPYWNR